MEETLPNLGQAYTITAQNEQNGPNLAQAKQDKRMRRCMYSGQARTY